MIFLGGIVITNENHELLEKVNSMMKEQNHHPRDFSMRLIISKYPKSSQKLFNIPGKFLDGLKTAVFTADGRVLEMDAAILVGEDGIVDTKSTINIEHQTNNLNQEKIDSLYEYKLHLIHENNIPSLTFVITNKKQDKLMKCYISHGCVYNVYYHVVDEDEIRKMLNTLRDKVKRQEELTELESLYFASISIFAENPINQQIIEELSHLFEKSIIRDTFLKLHMHQVLKRMIKEIWAHDENKIRELLTVITRNFDSVDYLSLSFVEQFEYDLAIKDEALEMQNKTITEDKKVISEKDNVISEMYNELSHKDNVISEMSDEISQKDEQIRKLEEQLALRS